MGSMQGTIATVDEVTGIAEELIPFLGLIPQLGPYLPALQALFQGVHTIAHTLPGGTTNPANTTAAVAQVTDHLTPGAPNAPALSTTPAAPRPGSDPSDTQNPNN